MQLSQRRTVQVVLAPALAAVVALSVAACSGSSSGAASGPANSSAPVTTPKCPTVRPTPSATSAALTKVLQSMPFDMPLPSGITPVSAMTTSDGIHVARFTTQTDLRTSVLFIVERYPKAGYVIGRGDAEATEADAPFVHGGLRGLTRVNEIGQCQTLWLVASVAVTSNGATSQILVPHPTSSVTSALPFG